MVDWRAEVRGRLRSARLAPTREADVVEELVQHLEDRHSELVAGGMSVEQADAAVLAELGDSDGLGREIGRLHAAAAGERVIPGSSSGRPLYDLWGDLRYAVRALAKNRAFTVVTLLSLALGIGATTAIFQLLDALSLRALPVEKADQLALVKIRDRNWGSGWFSGWHPHLSNALWEQLRDRQEAFSGVFAWGDNTFNLNPSGESHYVHGLLVSGDFFRVLGVRPAQGRFFTLADDRRGCVNPGAVVSHGFWQRELGGDPAVVGRKLTLDGHTVDIIGVSEAGFFGPEIGRFFDVAVPLCMEATLSERNRLEIRHAWWLSVIGRLKPGWTIERASAHVDALSKTMLEATVPPSYPPPNVERYMQYRFAAYPAATGLSELREDYSTPLYFLLGIAAVLLLIACANLANLLLARASVREREIAVRLALGATRGRLLRQLLAESLLFAALGAALGLLLARLLGEFVIAFLSQPGRPARFIDLDPDWRVLAFTIGLAGLTCLLFGLVPALRASNTEVGLVLKATGRGTTERGGGFPLRRLLVVVQVALSFVLLVGALLFSRSLFKLVTVDAGFEQAGVLVVDLDLTALDLPKPRRVAYKEQLLERLRATPGVEHAASATIIPISGNGWNDDVWLDGGAAKPHFNAFFNRVSAGYFATMRTPLLAGRDFQSGDAEGAPNVAIINQTLARKLGAGPNPVGQRFRREADGSGRGEQVFEIIGLVRDTKYREMREEFSPIAFVPSTQDDAPDAFPEYVVRSRLPPADLTGVLKNAVAEASPAIRLDFQSLAEKVRFSLLPERMMALLAAFFGLLAALLASIGLYGVIAYSVARRTQEIGIRMALGADPGQVARMIVAEAGGLLAVGLAIGIVLALAVTRAAAALLYGLKPHDPLTFGLAVGLLGLVALLASVLPARRASRVDPMVALRTE
ncbi:MAG TPA: ABC transporter permease [Polyangia bacterium]|nr:ABC transporter permease [Polyangia bacterium]